MQRFTIVLLFLAVSGCKCDKGQGIDTQPDADQSTVMALSPILADGVATSTVTVTLLNAAGEFVEGVEVTLGSDRPGDTVVSPAAITDAAGTTTGTIASSEIGPAIVSASAAGVDLSQRPTVLFIAACAANETFCSGTGCVDTDTDLDHCGACGADCPDRPNSSVVCQLRNCAYICDTGFAACSGAPGLGCNERLDTAENCGSCGARCPDRADASGDCIDPVSGACGILCDAGFGNCNGDPLDGCEEALDQPAHCGVCGNDCDAVLVVNGTGACADPSTLTCGVTCDAGFGDCNVDPLDGCEADFTDAASCGDCSTVCAGGPRALGVCADPSSGTCTLQCDPGFDDCDGAAPGCETNTDTSNTHCGVCGSACIGGTQVIAQCAGATCGRTCNPGFADCNLDIDDPAGDGCETDLELGLDDCGCKLSPTGATATCLTADSGARVVVWTTVENASGGAVSGASVTIDSADLTWLSAVQESSAVPGTYFRTAQVQAAPTGPITVTLTAADSTSCGATTDNLAPVVIDIVPPVSATATVSGGCSPQEGNVRVQVVAKETGAPIVGALVMVGENPSTTAFFDDYEAFLAAGAGALSNNVLTDAQGYASFYDYGNGLEGGQMLTAGATSRAYVSFVGIETSDVVLALPLTGTVPPTIILGGEVTGTAYPFDNDGNIEAALLTPVLSMDFIARFDLARLLDDSRVLTLVNSGGACLFAGQTFGVSGNIHVPFQTEFSNCGVSGGAPYLLTRPQGTTEDIVALRVDGEVLSLIGGGTAIDLIAAMTPVEIGMLQGVDVSSSQSNVDISLSNTLSATMPVDILNAPLGSVYGITVADLDGLAGNGRLVLEGFEIQQNSTGFFTMLTTATPSGLFANKDDLAGAIVFSSGGTTLVIDRVITDATTTRTLDSFFAVPMAAILGTRTFQWADVAGTTPDYHMGRSVLRRTTVVGDFKQTHEPFWIVYTAPEHRLASGNLGFDLPTLPAGAPLVATGGFLSPGAGQANQWFLSLWYLGLNPSPATFDLANHSFGTEASELTRVSSDTLNMP